MSDDLIRRSDAIKHCEIWRDRAKEAKDKDGWWMADNLLRLMKDTPTAEPKRGEWKRRIVDNGFNADWVCSECGYRVKTDFVDYNFCPNCGADMRKGADDE